MRKIFLCILFVFNAPAVNALTVTEINDFDGSASFSAFGESNIGVLDSGINSISGSLAGQCSGFVGCNGSSAGDTQDSFLIEIAAGSKITGIYTTTSNVAGPANFNVSLSAYKNSFANNILFVGSLPINSSSLNLLLTDAQPALYSINIFGQNASESGLYSLDYTVQIEVSSVPVPAAAWLFGSGLLGLISITRRHKKQY